MSIIIRFETNSKNISPKIPIIIGLNRLDAASVFYTKLKEKGIDIILNNDDTLTISNKLTIEQGYELLNMKFPYPHIPTSMTEKDKQILEEYINKIFS